MPPDLSELIVHDHRVIAGLLATLGEANRTDRFPLAHRLLDEVAAHTSAELQILYPALRDIVPGGVDMANRGQAQHDQLRPAMTAVEQGHPGDETFEDGLRTIVGILDAHVPSVENEFLPALRVTVGEDTMAQLGAVYASLKDNLPSGLQALPGNASAPRFTTS
jgi:hemerythrin superfamily protein